MRSSRAAPTSARSPPSPSADDAALQLYTSGTTGKPKGAVITHANLAVQQELLGEAWGLARRRRAPPRAAAPPHARPRHRAAHRARRRRDDAHARRASTRAASGTRMARAPPSSWRCPTMYHRSSSPPSTPPTTRRARAGRRARERSASPRAAAPRSRSRSPSAGARSPARIPLERFGMTEIGVGITNPLDAARGARAASASRCRPSRRASSATTARRRRDRASSGSAGRACSRATTQRDEATRERLRRRRRRALVQDRRHRRRATADGYVRILGRTSVDILKSGGYKLSALEIEEVLREHAAVAEVAVVGFPGREWGDRVVACVVAARRTRGRMQRGRPARIRERAPRALQGAETSHRDEPSCPRNAVGKVVKPELIKKLGRLKRSTAAKAAARGLSRATSTPALSVRSVGHESDQWGASHARSWYARTFEFPYLRGVHATLPPRHWCGLAGDGADRGRVRRRRQRPGGGRRARRRRRRESRRRTYRPRARRTTARSARRTRLSAMARQTPAMRPSRATPATAAPRAMPATRRRRTVQREHRRRPVRLPPPRREDRRDPRAAARASTRAMRPSFPAAPTPSSTPRRAKARRSGARPVERRRHRPLLGRHRAWRFDFSCVTTAGDYYVLDESNGARSAAVPHRRRRLRAIRSSRRRGCSITSATAS